MPKVKLTATSVKNLSSPSDGRIEYFDLALPGFALRISEKGHKSWVVFYRIGKRQRRMTIGSYPLFSLAEAREEARQAMQIVAKGEDPAEVRAEARRTLNSSDTVSKVIAEFIDKYAKSRNRTWRETQRIFELNVEPYIGRRIIQSITRRDIREIINRVTNQSSAVRANRILANIRKLFNWAIDQDIIDLSPAAGIKPPGKERERERVLNPEEISLVEKGCNQLGWPFGPFTMMLLATAQRLNEVSQMKWEEIDFNERVWTIPREKTKVDRSHEVPLSQFSFSILSRLPKLGHYVFMSGRREDRAISGFSKAKKQLDLLSGVTKWRYHDLRRTAGTNMARLGVPISTISRILNHAEGGVTKIYARHSYLDEKRHALDTWSEALTEILNRT